MASATIFKGFNTPVENKSLIQITKDIKEGKYKDNVLKVTALVRQGQKENADKLKKMLPAFTPSGTFSGGRKMEHLIQYSGFIILDLDKLSQAQLAAVFSIAASLPTTFSCFLSPSGNGLKILVEVTSTAEYHEQAYKQVSDYYERKIGLPIDRSGKDVTRLCFVSYDPDAYRSINNQKFAVTINGLPILRPLNDNPLVTRGQVQPVSYHFELALEMQVKFTDNKIQYSSGNRNNYIYLFASNCNRAGIPEDEALGYCRQHFDLDDQETKKSVGSAYKNHNADFAKFANLAKSANDKQSDATNDQAAPPPDTANPEPEDYLKNTSVIPAELYQQMPDIIRLGAAAFNEVRERDVFLTGALAIISGCLPGVKGVYAGQEVFPNLYSFTIAPAASGKGALKFAKMLADDYHNTVRKASCEAERLYDTLAAARKSHLQKNSKDQESSEVPPEKPPFRVVNIPANISYAKIIWHLEQNEGSGIICETEADTLGNAFKQDWGSYSDLLRKAFHHEKISSSKKANNEFIEVDTPTLSIALSGTPSQVTGLIASAEDGLFSRFIFYAYKVAQIWKDVSPDASGVNLTDHFRTLSKKVFDMVLFLEQSNTEIALSPEQWAILNRNCTQWLNDIVTFVADEAASVVKRLGLIMYRIAMIFTALRKFENAEVSPVVQCTNIDFKIALELSEIYMQHSILLFNNLPKQKGSAIFTKSDYKRKFFEALPNKFSRAEAITLGDNFKMSAKNVDNFLRDAANSKFLTKPKTGFYQKV